MFFYRNKKVTERVTAEVFARKTTATLQHNALSSKEIGISGNNPNQKLIVSLTTYGSRIEGVYVTIESLFQQTHKADKIILWLSRDEFNASILPETLKLAQARGLEIGYCKDMLSYKKLLPTLQAYPNDLIITADDDILYPANFIEKLYKSYMQNPDVIHCNLGHRITYKKSGRLEDYTKWGYVSPGEDVETFNLTGTGSLYFPDCFHDDVYKDNIFLETCPTTDDIWFKCMNVLNGVSARRIEHSNYFDMGHFKYFTLPGSQETALWRKNSDRKNGASSQLENLCNRYPEFRAHIEKY